MPIHIVADVVSKYIPSDYYVTIAASLVAITFLKSWAAGPTLTDSAHCQRDLHGRVVLVTGGFTPLGLVVLSELSHRGAQIIALTPTLSDDRVIQLVQLLRDSTSNELIYAEECDPLSLSSISAFTKKWNEGDTATAGPSGGGRGGARRVDIVLFLPLEEASYSVGEGRKETFDAGVERAHGADVLARFHLLNALLPSLLLLPPDRDIRLVNVVSPWYAAGVGALSTDDPDWRTRRFPSGDPWRAQGAAALHWTALTRELQKRLQLLADADTRPRTKLPGIDPQAPMPTAQKLAVQARRPANVVALNVCTGFERNAHVLPYILPSRPTTRPALRKEETDETTEEKEQVETIGSDSATREKSEQDAAERLRAAIDPRRPRGKAADRSSASPNSQTTASADSLRAALDATPYVPLRTRLFSLLRYALVVVLWPPIWLFAKSPSAAAQMIVFAVCAPIDREAVIRMETGQDETRVAEMTRKSTDPEWKGLIPGEMYRDGKLVRPPLPDSLLAKADAGSKLWAAEEARVEAVLGGVRRPGDRSASGKSKADTTAKESGAKKGAGKGGKKRN